VSFHVTIHIIFYSCQSSLEKQLNHAVLKTWNMTQIKKMRMTTTIFKHSGCLHWCARWKHLAVCRQLHCSPARYSITMECKICVVSSKWQKCDAFYQAWIWLDTAEEVRWRCVRTHTSAVNEVRRSSGKEEEEDKHNLEQVMIFTKAHAVYKIPLHIHQQLAWQREHSGLRIAAVMS